MTFLISVCFPHFFFFEILLFFFVENQIESIYCSHCGALSVDKSSQLKKSSFAEMVSLINNR